MPEHTVADALRRERLLVLVLAAKSAMRTVLSRQLELLNCTVECVETMAEAQRYVVGRSPHFLMLECARFPMHVREITELFRSSGGDGRGRPLLQCLRWRYLLRNLGRDLRRNFRRDLSFDLRTRNAD